MTIEQLKKITNNIPNSENNEKSCTNTETTNSLPSSTTPKPPKPPGPPPAWAFKKQKVIESKTETSIVS